MGPLLIGQRHNGREILALLHTNLADWDAVETGIDEGDVAFRHHQPVFRRLKGIPEKINLIMHGGVCRDGQAGNGAERFGMICPEHIGHGGRLDIGMAVQFDRQEVIVLIYALRRCRSLQLQGHRITDRMIIIRDPEIPGMLALLVFNAPVPPGIEGKGLFRRAPAVFGQPGAVCRGLMLRKEVFFGIIVVPADDGHRVVGCAKVPGVMRPFVADVFRLVHIR